MAVTKTLELTTLSESGRVESNGFSSAYEYRLTCLPSHISPKKLWLFFCLQFDWKLHRSVESIWLVRPGGRV